MTYSLYYETLFLFKICRKERVNDRHKIQKCFFHKSLKLMRRLFLNYFVSPYWLCLCVYVLQLLKKTTYGCVWEIPVVWRETSGYLDHPQGQVLGKIFGSLRFSRRIVALNRNKYIQKIGVSILFYLKIAPIHSLLMELFGIVPNCISYILKIVFQNHYRCL